MGFEKYLNFPRHKWVQPIKKIFQAPVTGSKCVVWFPFNFSRIVFNETQRNDKILRKIIATKIKEIREDAGVTHEEFYNDTDIPIGRDWKG